MTTKTSYKVSPILLTSLFFISCQKESQTPAVANEEFSTAANNGSRGHLKQTKKISSEVVSKWMTMPVRHMIAAPTAVANVAHSRHYVYGGVAGWNPFLGTPPHPEYPSAHSTLSAANAEALTIAFGDNHSFTDQTFDYLGFPSRSYNSFGEIGNEAGLSRLYGGIHYRQSVDDGLWQGKKVAQNSHKKLKFLKE